MIIVPHDCFNCHRANDCPGHIDRKKRGYERVRSANCASYAPILPISLNPIKDPDILLMCRMRK